MGKMQKKPPRQAPSDDVFREFAWNVAGAVHGNKTNASGPPRKPAPAR